MSDPVQVTLRCVDVKHNPKTYDLETVHLERDDGIAGWLSITGTCPPVGCFEMGKRYTITVTEETP